MTHYEVNLTAFSAEQIRKDFPILQTKVNGKPLVYLDNAATAQKPVVVIDRMNDYYRNENANVHRGIHTLSQQATTDYESTRKKVQAFIHAAEEEEIIFTSGTTESINLVASTFARMVLKPGDEILISAMEHHSNIVPWQMILEEKGGVLKVIPVNDKGELILEELDSLLSAKTKLVAVSHMSNTLGTINPVKDIIKIAHEKGIPVLVDAAQSIPHFPVDVQDLDCDFLAFSGHKLFGPTGIGILYGKKALLDTLQPYHGGGDMIKTVTFEKTTYNELPFRLEAGTPNIAAGIGLGSAIDYVNSLDWKSAVAWEHELLTYTTEKMLEVPGLRIIGTAANKGSVISFVMKSAHASDIGMILDQEGIAIRTGHHCTQPVMKRFGVPATARASFAFYNTKEDADALIRGLLKINDLFG
ncbi:MAG: cysteine desulfurase [Bacteroidetes bacterium]|nr:cysteine desulfurase [Bacteroidota bacterium]